MRITSRGIRSIVAGVVVFLLLGAIINIAVAWGCAVFAPIRHTVKHGGVMSIRYWDPPYWQTAVFAQPGALYVDASAWKSPEPTRIVLDHEVPSWSAALSPPTEGDFRRGRWVREFAYGWPLVSLYSRDDSDTLQFGLKFHIFPDETRTLPLRPIVPGFLINTIIDAPIAWLLLLGLLTLRRRHRLKRGLCPACAYPMGASPVCTECGRALPGRAEAAA